MSNEWKMVPVEPTEEMVDAGDIAYSWSVENIYRAMLAAAPVPPAGDVEVLGYKQKDQWWIDTDPCVTHAKTLGIDYIEVCDRAHVTRLTAERDGLLGNCADLSSRVRELEHKTDYWKAQNEALQSELTKARELLLHMQTYSNKYPTSPIAEYTKQIAEVLARQSAPAAKGGSDE